MKYNIEKNTYISKPNKKKIISISSNDMYIFKKIVCIFSTLILEE